MDSALTPHTSPPLTRAVRPSRCAPPSRTLVCPTQDIQHINAHGTATPIGDRTETEAIKDVFGEYARSVMISATKFMHGHIMGATGAVEAVATVMALRHQAVPPTANLLEPDPECDLDYVPIVARQGPDIHFAMSNSFAFWR